jgi:hypothetical protein
LAIGRPGTCFNSRRERLGAGGDVKRAILRVVVVVAALTCSAAPASGALAYPGLEHLQFAAGPYSITPGANLILLDHNHVPKPDQDGYLEADPGSTSSPSTTPGRSSAPSGTCIRVASTTTSI